MREITRYNVNNRRKKNLTPVEDKNFVEPDETINVEDFAKAEEPYKIDAFSESDELYENSGSYENDKFAGFDEFIEDDESSEYDEPYEVNDSFEHNKHKKADHAHKHSSKKRKHKKTLKKSKLIAIIVAAVLVVLIGVCAIVGLNLVNKAKDLKANLGTFVDCIKDKDVNGAEKALLTAEKDTDDLKVALNGGFWRFAAKLPKVGKDIQAVSPLLDIVDEAFDDILEPLIDVMKEYPLTDLKVGDGFNTKLINSYLDFLEAKLPTIEKVIGELDNVEIGLGIGEKIAEYRDKITTLLETYHEASDYIPFVRAFIGKGEDKLYVFAAQNSAEIRASGGFPGSVGTIRIKDGVLTIGDFESCFYVFAPTVTERSEVTDVERTIFGGWIDAPRDACFIPDFTRVGQIWAVAYEDNLQYDFQYVVPMIPAKPAAKDQQQSQNTGKDPAVDPSSDIEVPTEGGNNKNALDSGTITQFDLDGDPDINTPGNNTTDNSAPTLIYDEANGYYVPVLKEDAQLVKVDGVVSLTPAIIQKMLKCCGEITLSDGTVLNGDNATRILQHDLYFKYYNKNTYKLENEWIADGLFSETAKQVMSSFVSSFGIGMIKDFYDIISTGIEENIVRIWMADEEEEEIVKKIGASGELNTDPENPSTGIYFSSADPSKMGYFLDINTEIGDSITNEDGSTTYDVRVTLHNAMTEEEVSEAHTYILGSFEGSIMGYISFVAPAGGMISDFEASNGMGLMWGYYKDLEIGYNFNVIVDRDNPIEISYKVTTSPEAKTPLRIVTTPTMTAFR